MSDRSVPFMNTVSAQPTICEMGLSPKMLGNKNSGFPLHYAFHMNALKYADYLCAFATKRGVTHYLDNVIGADQHENGNIAAVRTQSGSSDAWDFECTFLAQQLCFNCFGEFFFTCCNLNSTPGCVDETGEFPLCEDSVCMTDPFCCQVVWDQTCVDAASENPACACCFSDPDCPDLGCDCCVKQETAGCSSESCQDAVCAVDPFCCAIQWDQVCADLAQTLPDDCACSSCPD